MKSILLFLLAVLLSANSFAQAPQGIPYQAVARNSSGTILSNQAIRARFTIHDITAGGTIVYQETFNPTTNSLGLFNVNVGMGTVVTGTFSSINWGTNSKFMQVEMDPAGGTAYVDMGTTQLMSVPYALYAGNAASAGPAGGGAVQTFTASGTWTKPTGLGANSVALIEGWGGGGGGAGGVNSGAGGGGGSYKSRFVSLSSLGESEVVTVGAGGTGGTGGSNGGNGGSSSVGTLLVAYGGTGGQYSGNADGGAGGGYFSTSAPGVKTNDIPGSEGIGATTISLSGNGYNGGGGGGCKCGSSNATAGKSVYGGGGGGGSRPGFTTAGGTSDFGGAGGTGPDSNTITTGGNGNAPGGGGGGGAQAAGGTGGKGRIKITIWSLN